MELIGSIIKRSRKNIDGLDLTRAKEYLKDGILLGLESMDSMMMRLAKNEFVFGRYVTYEELMKDIENVTTNEVLEAARRILCRVLFP